jgi:hypothetical protein
MYNDFREYSAAFHAKQSDILHFGVKGMRWGVIRWKDKFANMFQRYKRENSFGDERDATKDKIVDERTVSNMGNMAIRTGTRRFSNKYRDQSQLLKAKSQLLESNGESETSKKIFSDSKDYMKKSEELKKMSELYGRNCPKTTLALELKKRGIDVNAKAKTKPIPDDAIANIYVNEKKTKCKSNKDFFDSKNYGKPGDHGAIRGAYPDGQGHIFNYTVLKDGTVQLEDAQSGKVMSLEDARIQKNMNIDSFTSGYILNLTNAEIDMDEVRKFDMFTVNEQNGSAMKLAQYERNVKKYIKNKKRAEKWMRNLAKGLDKLKGLFKRR